MTLAAVKKQDFDSLYDERLGWACMELHQQKRELTTVH